MADDRDGTARPSTRARGVLSCAEGRRRGAVIGWCEHPAAECRHAEHVEKAPADVGTVHGDGPVALREIKALIRPAEGAVEQVVCACADFLPYGVRPRSVREQR